MPGAAFRLTGDGQTELLHLADETWIAASAARVGEAVADPVVWRWFWPDLRTTLEQARGDEGVRLAVVGPRWQGSCELYVHAEFDGVVLFHFLRIDPAGPVRIRRRDLSRQRRRRGRVGRAAAWRLKDQLEGRAPPEGGRRRR